MSGEKMSAILLASCINQPMSMDQLLAKIYGDDYQDKPSSSSSKGRIYTTIETMIEMDALTPMVVKGRLMFKYKPGEK
jgi:hypothetical protein